MIDRFTLVKETNHTVINPPMISSDKKLWNFKDIRISFGEDEKPYTSFKEMTGVNRKV